MIGYTLTVHPAYMAWLRHSVFGESLDDMLLEPLPGTGGGFSKLLDDVCVEILAKIIGATDAYGNA